MTYLWRNIPCMTLGAALVLSSGCEVGGRNLPLLQAPAWRHDYSLPDPEGKFSQLRLTGDDLLMRYAEAGTADLLVTRSEASIVGFDGRGNTTALDRKYPFAVYRYETSTERLLPSTDAAWEQGQGPIAECPNGGSTRELSRNPRSYKLFYRGAELSTRGPLVVDFSLASAEKFAVVMSADGSSFYSVLGFGGGGATGQHYFQILSLEDGTFIGDPLRLPFTTKSAWFGCWSSDEKYFVFYNDWQLVIIPTNLPQD